MPDWSLEETSKHQDHVVAHVLGTTVLGFLIADEAAHLLLDIGFIWTIYLDGEMGLLPQSVAFAELELGEDDKALLQMDALLLMNAGRAVEGLKRLTPAPADCLIVEVGFESDGERRRILVIGEDESLAIETSLANREISVRPVEVERDAG
jgi:hypothetical protein